MLKVFTFDIEANGRRELNVGGKDKENSWEAEVTEVHCIVIRCKLSKKVWRYVSNPMVVEQCDGSLTDGWNHLMTAMLLIAHNGIDYDMAVLRRLESTHREEYAKFLKHLGASPLDYLTAKDNRFIAKKARRLVTLLV